MPIGAIRHVARASCPSGSPISVGELVSKATAQLQGLEIDFNVDETGKVLHMPELPEDMPEDLRFVLQEAIDTLETAFLPVPQRALKVGDTWKDDKKRGRKGKLGRYLEGEVTTKVDGFFRDTQVNTDLTKLTISESEKEVTTAKTGSHEVSKEIQTTAFFAHSDRYLQRLVRDGKTFDPGNATIFAGLVAQAVVLTAIASSIAGTLVVVLQLLLPPGSIPLLITPGRIILSSVLLLVAAVLGCSFSLRRVLRVDPASAIGTTS